MIIWYDARQGINTNQHEKTCIFCAHLTADSGNRLHGWRCRRTWRSPPGQNSVNKHDHFGDSIDAYNVGKNGCSNSSKISFSDLERPSLLRLASSFLSITLAAKKSGPSLSFWNPYTIKRKTIITNI